MSGRLTELGLAQMMARGDARLVSQNRVSALAAPVICTIPGEPIGKPRQTQSDKWRERPCVMRYRTWADHARKCCPDRPATPGRIHVIAYFGFPKSYSTKEREALQGMPHRQKPDSDNVCKSVVDALVSRDECIYEMRINKYWTDEKGPRVEVTLYP